MVCQDRQNLNSPICPFTLEREILIPQILCVLQYLVRIVSEQNDFNTHFMHLITV